MPRTQGNGVTIGSSVGSNYFFIDWSESVNWNSNSSTISWTAYFHYQSSDAQLDDGDVSIGGSLRWDVPGRVKNFAGTYTTRDHWLANGSYDIGHNTTGGGTFNVSGSIAGAIARSSASGDYSLTQIDRYAYQAPTPTVSRSADGGTLYMSTSDPGAPNSGPQRDFSWQVHVAGGGWFDIGATGGTSNSYAVNPNTTYYVRVLAYNDAGNSGWSGESSASYGVPTVPTGVTATKSTTTPNRISVSWTAPSYTGSGVDYYHVYRNGVQISQPTGTSINDDGLTRGTTYTYTIYAHNSTGWSNVSSGASAVAPGVPSAPSTVYTPTRVGRNVTVTAPKDSNGFGNAVTEYRIQYATSDDNYATWYGWNGTSGVLNAYNPMNIAGTEASFYYSMLTAAKTYKFRVYAVNSTGAGNLPADAAVLATPFFLPASGKRWNGISWDPTAVAKRWNSVSGWADISTAKRYNATLGSWEELT